MKLRAFLAGAVTGALIYWVGARAVKAHWWVLMVILAAACVPAQAKPKVVRLKAELRAVPRVALAPVRVICTLHVQDPKRLVRCPSIVEWAVALNGERIGGSGMVTPEEPCEPYGLIEDVPTSFSEVRTFRWGRRGLYQVAACLGNSVAIGCDHTTVEVR